MLIKFSKNPFRLTWGIVYYNRKSIILFILISVTAYVLYRFFGINLHMPAIPVSILGGGLAIFLAFRNNSAYDRWWEARKIWGGIVNYSRSFGMELLAFVDSGDKEKDKTAVTQMVYRHLAYINALKLQLRKQNDLDEIKEFLSLEEFHSLSSAANGATQLNNSQGQAIRSLHKNGWINDMQQKQIMETLKEFYNLQGKAERIKNTVFPYYYQYFTRLFLWLFIVSLPCILVEKMGWTAIPMSVAVSFVFYILEKTGYVTEDPFENRAADTPMSSICRTIEIDMRQQLGETSVPAPLEVEYTRMDASFVK